MVYWMGTLPKGTNFDYGIKQDNKKVPTIYLRLLHACHSRLYAGLTDNKYRRGLSSS